VDSFQAERIGSSRRGYCAKVVQAQATGTPDTALIRTTRVSLCGEFVFVE
jgi:hypothetical protein